MVKDSNEGNRKAGQGANEAYMDWLGRMAADDPELDDAGRAVVDGFLSRLSERTGREGPFAVGEPERVRLRQKQGRARRRPHRPRDARPAGARRRPGWWRTAIDRRRLRVGRRRTPLADMVAEDIEDNLAGIADEVASDRYGVGLEDLR